MLGREMDSIFKLFFSILVAFSSLNILAYCYKSTQTNFLYLPINWTEVARVRSISKSDLSLSLDDFKSSACDVTAHSCDVYCCNDTDCSPEQIQIFHCLDMQPETEVTMDLKSLDCHLTSYWTPSWFPFLCYVKNNSAVLGFNYNDMKILDNQVDFLKIVDQERFYTFLHPPNQDISSNIITDRSYTYGSSIQVFSDHLKDFSLFELPHPAFSGLSCTTSKPVQFLLDSSWECKQSMTAQDCHSSNSPYNLMNLLISGKNDSLWELANIFPPKLIRNLKDKSVGEVFLKNVCLRSGSEFGWVTKRIFNIEETKMPLPQTEKYIVECGELLNILKTSYDSNKVLCRNVLVGAQFIFEWSGSEIARLNATYVLTDIVFPDSNSFNKGSSYYHSRREFLMKRKNLERNKAYVTQVFNVAYIPHAKEMKNFSVSQENASLRSGNPGYLIGKPLVSGNLRLKPFKEEFNSSIGDQDILWQPFQMSLWRSDNDCGSRSSVLFGVDSSSSCTVEVTYDEFKNCSALREKVRRIQESLVAAEWVAKGGDLKNLTSASSLVPVIRLGENSSASDGFWDGFHAPMTCKGIPAQILIHVLYQDTAADIRKSGFSSFHFVEGVSVSLETQNWTWIWSDRGRRAFRLVSSVTYTLTPTEMERSTNRFWLDLPQDSWLRAVNLVDIPATDAKAIATVAPAVLAVAFLLCRRGLMGHSTP